MHVSFVPIKNLQVGGRTIDYLVTALPYVYREHLTKTPRTIIATSHADHWY